MRKIFYFVAVSLLGISCNRDDNNNDGEKETPKEINVGFKVSTTQELSNLQVGERLVVNFEIEDKDTINTTYIIKPETENKVFHQKINVDYTLSRLIDDEENDRHLFISHMKDIELSSKEQKGDFYINILRPGNFQHKYILEKYVNGKKVGETSADFLFNAVKISAATIKVTGKVFPFVSYSYERPYIFVIDDGEERYDNYLRNENGKTHTYIASYDGKYHYSNDGHFESKQPREFRKKEKVNMNTNIPKDYIEEIRIQQKQADGTINNIIYKNIKIDIQEHKIN